MRSADENTGHWDPHEWAGDTARDEVNPSRWNSNEWGGDAPWTERLDLEGDAGPADGDRPPGEQHRVPDKG